MSHPLSHNGSVKEAGEFGLRQSQSKRFTKKFSIRDTVITVDSRECKIV